MNVIMDQDQINELVDEALAAAQTDEMRGFCSRCGAEYDGLLEPDARGVLCRSCGHRTVMGAEEIVITFADRV